MGKILRDGLRPIILLAALVCGTASAAAAPKTLMLYGDSLLAGLGLPVDEAFAARLQAGLAAAGQPVIIVNASVSGDTSAAGLARLDWSLGDRPDAVMLELGANDMLRAMPAQDLADNLTTILTRLRDEHIPVLLIGMRASPGLGVDYTTAFDAVYPTLAAQFDVPLYPFFLDGVALDPALNQADGIHPNADGVKVIVQQVLPAVEQLLAS